MVLVAIVGRSRPVAQNWIKLVPCVREPGYSRSDRIHSYPSTTMSSLSFNPKGLAFHERKNPDDIVITMAIRSPMTKARKGGFKDTRSDELMTEIIKVSSYCASLIEFRPTTSRTRSHAPTLTPHS